MRVKNYFAVAIILCSHIYVSADANPEGFAIAKLSLESCLERLLESNLEIKSEAISTQLRLEDILIVGEKFQSSIDIELKHGDLKRPSDFIFEQISDIKEKDSSLNIGIQKLWESGTLTSLEWSHSRVETNTSLNKINPGFADKLNLKVIQPLFQGRGKRIQTIELGKTKYLHQISEIRQRMKEEASLLQVSQLYWSLSLARAYLVPLKSEIQLSKQIVANKQAHYKQKMTTLYEVEKSIKNLKNIQLAFKKAENNVAQINQQLVAEVFPIAALENKNLSIIPTTPFEYTPIKTKYNLNTLKTKAFFNRLELKKEALNLAIAELNIIQTKDKTKSNTSLFATAGSEGLSNNSINAMGRNHRFSFPNWELGIQLSFFLDPVSRKSHWQKAILQKDKLALIENNIKAQIVNELTYALSIHKNTQIDSDETVLNIELQGKLIKRITKEIELGRNIALNKARELVKLKWMAFKQSENISAQWMSQAQLLSTQGLLFKFLIKEKT